MSITATTRTPFAGHEQADTASLVIDGLFYRCYTWLNAAEQRIEAACYLELEFGQEVLVFSNVIAEATQADCDDTENLPLDSPKLIATATHFVVHWLQATERISPSAGVTSRDWSLHRATMNMAAFSAAGWDDRGAVGLWQPDALYDVAPVIGSDTDFVVARKTDVGEITVQRFDGYSWIDFTWTTLVPRDIQPTVLSAYAHDADNDVVLSYQPVGDGGTTLWSAHLDADDGGSFVDVVTFDAFEPARYPQAGHCRVGPHRVAVVAEAQTFTNASGGIGIPPHAWIHHLVYREIDSGDASVLGNEHWAAQLYLCSRPWAYANGTTAAGTAPDVYCVVAYKSIYETNDWEQAYLFAVNLDFPLWGDVADGPGLRPRPISTAYTIGIPDARASGWHPESGDLHVGGPSKRQNHLSNASGAPPFGPDVKTRTVAVGIFAKLDASITWAGDDTELLPENAGVSWLRVYLEDPWTIHRDNSDPEQPRANFKFPFARTACQSVEIGRGLFFAGGTPAIYDGRQVVECGFPWKPEIFAANAYNDDDAHWTGDLTVTGTYQWYAVFSWRDNAGQMHRSGPSRIFGYTMQGDENGIVLRLRTLTISLKDARAHYPLAQAVQIEIFRTTAGGTMFYRVYGASTTTTTGPNFRPVDTPTNNPEADYVDVFDGVSDAHLELQGLGPYQYDADAAGTPTTLQGPLPQTVPAMTAIAVWNNRVWGQDALDPSVLLYSDEVLPDYGGDYYQVPVFTDSQTFRIGDVGEVVAAHAMNNSLVVFTASTIYALNVSDAGDGLLNVSVEVLHEGTGCIEPRSIVLAPPGLFFQSAKGFYLLSRSRELDYVSAGAAVEDEIRAAGNVRSATLLEDRHQVRLVVNGDVVVTQTSVFTLNGVGTVGTWSIEFVEAGVTVETSQGVGTTTAELALALRDAVLALVGTTLDGVVATALAVGSQLTVVFEDGVHDQTFVLDQAGGATFTVEDTEEIATTPRVLLYDYFFRQWSRADLVQSNANTRLAEAVDGCAWRGLDGAIAHVVLTQGALLVERGPADPLAYTDQTSTGDVGIPIDLQSSWFHAAGIAGYQRVRSIGIQASKPNASEYSVDLDYCRDGDYEHPETETGLAVQVVSPAYTRVRPSVQKASALRVRIYETTGVQNSENIRVTALVFDVGVKKGPRRVAPTQIAS